MMSFSQSETTIIQMLSALEERISQLTQVVEGLDSRVSDMDISKDWYSTRDVAELMGVTGHTVRERWCNQSRIACEKNPVTGKWRIPGHEYKRLKRGGRPKGI